MERIESRPDWSALEALRGRPWLRGSPEKIESLRASLELSYMAMPVGGRLGGRGI